MATFKVSQGELWHRVYVIKAETLEEAKKTFEQYLITYAEKNNRNVTVKEPEYVEDIDDILWFDEHGEVQ